MRKMRLPAASALAVLSTVLLMGCAHNQGVATATGPLTIDTPLDVIAANPQGKAILDRDVPGIMNSPKYTLFSDMSLVQIQNISNGRIPQQNLDQVKADLARLAASEEAAKKAAAKPPAPAPQAVEQTATTP